jgi:hypothetical protein
VTATATRGYLVRRLARSDGAVPLRPEHASADRRHTHLQLHVTFIRDSVKHYHKECTEAYYILRAGQDGVE